MSKQKESSKSRNAHLTSLQNNRESPIGVKNFEGNDDQTPLRDGKAGNSINALNFGALVSSGGKTANDQAQNNDNQKMGVFHLHRVSQ